MQKKNSLINEHIKQYDAFSVSQFDGSTDDPNSILQPLRAVSFLSEKQLIVVRDSFLNKSLVQKLELDLEHISETTDVIFYETKPDKRLTFYKLLKKVATTHEYEVLSLDELIRWAVGYAKNLQAEMSSAVARYLIERTSSDQLSLSNELAKLASFSSNITKESVDLLTEQSYNNTVFDLLTAVFSQKKKQALALFHQLKNKNVDSFEVLSMIIWQVHVYLVIATNKDMSHKEIALAAKLNPFVLQKSADAIRSINTTTVKKWIVSLNAIDIASKTKSYDLDAAIEHFILSA